jgi:hypothetical protein
MFEHIHVSSLRYDMDHQRSDGKVMEQRKSTSSLSSERGSERSKSREEKGLTWQVLDEDKFARAQMAC